MSAFLWVEDFEGGSKYQEFAHALFGQALKLEADSFPGDEIGLRAFLEKRQIILATNFAEAMQLIVERQNDFDSVVLDIDLPLLGEDIDKDEQFVLPLLKRWYGYDPELKGADLGDSLNSARNKMKMVAGYHLFIELVINQGFPRKRILLCSNHGDHLKSISKNFEPAYIEVPPILQKHNKEVKKWITAQRNEPYLKLRRWVIIACSEMLARLQYGQTTFLMLELPGDGVFRLTLENAKILLETLPKLLQTHKPPVKDRRLAYRLFVRVLTQDWDNKVDFKKMKNKSPQKGFAAVLVHARNWTSHDAEALSQIDESDVAFLFLIALRACFELPENKIESFEDALLPLIGQPVPLDRDHMKEAYENSYAEIEELYKKLKPDQKNNFFSDMVNEIHQGGGIPAEKQAKYLMQILWHQLHSRWNNEGIFSPKLKYFSQPDFLKELTQRIYQKSFNE